MKNPNKIAEFIYKCVKTELDGFFTKTEVKIEGTQKHVHEHHHHHVFEKKKKKTASDYYKEKYGHDIADDLNEFFPSPEKEEETPERKILTDKEVKVRDISKEEETEAFNEVMQGCIETGATKEMLPDWFDTDPNHWSNYEAQQKAKTENEPKMSIEEMLKALRDNTSPEIGLQA